VFVVIFVGIVGLKLKKTRKLGLRGVVRPTMKTKQKPYHRGNKTDDVCCRMFEKGDLSQQQRTQAIDNVMVPNKLAKQWRWKHGVLLFDVESRTKRKETRDQQNPVT
jgi:hypothetical protein